MDTFITKYVASLLLLPSSSSSRSSSGGLVSNVVMFDTDIASNFMANSGSAQNCTTTQESSAIIIAQRDRLFVSVPPDSADMMPLIAAAIDVRNFSRDWGAFAMG